MKPINFAHRGASGYCPENTLAAFLKAVQLGATGIETDVQMTKDGCLVLIHDETLNRTTTGQGWIKDSTLKELKQLDAGSWFHSQYAGEEIPLLDELMQLAKDHSIILNLELKNSIVSYHGMEQKILDCIQKYRMESQVILSSFNHFSLYRCKQICRNVSTGLLYKEKKSEAWDYYEKIGINALHPYKGSVSEAFVEQAHAHDLKVYPWTVNKVSEMKQIISLSADGLITDYPDRLNSLL